MNELTVLGIVFKSGAAVLAVTLARRQAEHWPVAWFLAVTAVADDAQFGLALLVFPPARARMVAAGLDPAATPFAGWMAFVCHLDNALFLTWAAGLVALALVLFAKRRVWPVAVVWIAVSIALAVAYPATRGEVLRRIYLGADLAALAVTIASVVSWLQRREGLPSFARFTALMIFLTEVALLFVGAWRWGIFDAWLISRVGYIALYAFVIVLHGGALWNIKP